MIILLVNILQNTNKAHGFIALTAVAISHPKTLYRCFAFSLALPIVGLNQ
jgi:hypothetical protein